MMKVRTLLSALTISASLGSFSFAQVTGKVTLEGEAPEMKEIDMSGVKECQAQHADPVYEETVITGEGGGLANVVVSIKKEEGMDLPGDAPKEPAVLDQKGCMYTPHVLPMMTGQEFVIKNSDPFLHNVHSMATINPAFNFGQPNVDPGKKAESPKAAETYKIKCDVHPWMLAYVRVMEHPFFGASGEDGGYTIKDVPDGQYTFVAWHEKYGEQEQTAEVKDGKTELNFKFNAAGAMADPELPMLEVKLASDKTSHSQMECCQNKGVSTAAAKGVEPSAKAE